MANDTSDAELIADAIAAEEALNALADDPGGWATFAVRGVAERGAEALRRAADRLAALGEALKPFSDYALVSVDANGWINRAGSERITDWFGPSDFFRARQALRTPPEHASTDASQGERDA